MFFPIGTTIINKNIYYSDTVLNLNELGENIKISSISNINEYELENCLNIILENNKDVVFNTIQYSKENKTVYFYTNKTINLDAWNKKDIKEYEVLSSQKQILEEIKKILTSKINNNPDFISLYDIFEQIKIKKNKYETMKELAHDNCQYFLNSKLENDRYNGFVIYDFDYKNNELRVGYEEHRNYKKITFIKKDSDLIIKSTETDKAYDILFHIGDKLSILYDEMLKYKPFFEQGFYGVESVNSIFNINITEYGVDLYLKNKNSLFSFLDSEFEIQLPSRDSKYSYKCNSNNIIELLKNNEDELFKRVFVKISDCPMWIKDELTIIREKQVKEQNKKEKRLELKRKIFPFLKQKDV